MFSFNRRRARSFALTLVLLLSALLAGASPVAAQDFRLNLTWVESDDPGSGGVLTNRLAATDGDTGTLGLFVTAGPGGLSAYDLSFEFDANLMNGLDLISVNHTPPAGWTTPAPPTFVESDETQPGQLQGFSASGLTGAFIDGEEVKIGEVTYRVIPGGSTDSFYIEPRVHAFSLASSEPGDLANAEANPAAATRQVNENEPTFQSAWVNYRFPHDLGGVRIRTAPICSPCEEPERGAVFRSTTDGGFGFFQTGVEVRAEFDASVRVDASRMDTPGALGGIEFDSPAVPIGVIPDRFLFVGASRAQDGTLTVFANDSGTNVGQPATFEVDHIELDWSFYQDQLTIRARALDGVDQTLVEGYDFQAMGSGALGLGLSGAGKGDQIGMDYRISGDLYSAPREKLLSELSEVIELERQAEIALDAGNRAKAQKLLEQAKERIEKGKKVPGSKPVKYEGALTDQVDAAIPDKKTQDAIKKKLKKVASKDGKAIDQLKKGGPALKVKKYIQSATKRKLQAKAMIETANRKEKGKTL